LDKVKDLIDKVGKVPEDVMRVIQKVLDLVEMLRRKFNQLVKDMNRVLGKALKDVEKGFTMSFAEIDRLFSKTLPMVVAGLVNKSFDLVSSVELEKADLLKMSKGVMMAPKSRKRNYFASSGNTDNDSPPPEPASAFEDNYTQPGSVFSLFNFELSDYI